MSLVSLLLGVSMYFIKGWMKDLKDAVKALTASVHKIEIENAVAKEKEASSRGAIDVLRCSIDDNNKNVGKLHSSIEKVWSALVDSNIVEKRISDKMTGNS